jgi:FKBP-type peptidyl-prolyl cis-trans isomerase (trigger factor)
MQFESLAKQFAVTKLPDSEVELVGSVPADDVAAYRTQALAHIAEHIELPGFRPGKVPHDLALKKVGEMAVLEEAVELLVKDLYPELIEVHKVDAVGRPDIRVTKLAPGNPVELSIRAAVYPEVTLPKNWTSIGESVALEPAVPATDEEVTQTLESLRKSRAAKDAEGKETVPELTDDFAKSLGAFENLDALKEQVRKGIAEEKVRHARDARRGKVIEKLLEGTGVAVPRVFVESELDKILSQMREDVARMGLSFEDYLKHSGKTEEGIRADFKDQAAKRAKLQLALNAIASEAKLEAEPTAVDAELKHAMEHFPDANPALVRIHVETVLRNEAALKLLEGEQK